MADARKLTRANGNWVEGDRFWDRETEPVAPVRVGKVGEIEAVGSQEACPQACLENASRKGVTAFYLDSILE